MAPVIEVQPWDEFTDVSKYGIPSDVPTLLDRLQQNSKRYVGNYAIFAGVILLTGVYFYFNLFFTFAVFLGLGAGAWYGLLNFKPELKPNSNVILAGLLAVFFFFAVKWHDDSGVIWYYLIFSTLPGIVHAALKQRNIQQKASASVKSAVNNIKGM